jgi:PAS domain S-box-containing protein
MGVIVFVALVWWGTASLDASERAREEARAALERSEMRYRRLFTQAPIPLYRTAPSGELLDANPAFFDLLRVPQTDALLGKNARDWYVHENDRHAFETAISENGFVRDQHLELRRRDGTTIWVLDSTRRIQDPDTAEISYEGGLIDVTERRIAEARLAASESRFRALIEHNADGISLFTSDGNVVYHSPAVRDILGVTPEDRVGHSFLERMHPEDAPAVQAVMGKLLASDGAFVNVEARLYHSDGSCRWVEARLANMLHDSSVGAIVANYRDITERREAEVALRESDERFREMAEHITEAFFVIDVPSSRPLYVSPPWSAIWGRPLADAYDLRGWDATMHPDDRSRVTASQMRVRSGEADESVYRIMRPDGSIRWIRRRAFPVVAASGQINRIVGVAEDITELRDAQERLTHSNKMEAVGRLAGGVAHDFNNLLTVIIAETSMLETAVGADPGAQESLAELRRTSENAITLTRQLLRFSRKQQTEFVVFDLNESITNTANVLRRLIGENIRLELKLTPDAGLIRADQGQLQQVLTNLAVNARDAMPDGGVLAIETARTEVFEGTMAINPDRAPGEYIVITVRDTGVGMTPEVRLRAFEPFFTTKDAGKGSGFGLATSHGIIKQTGGTISLESSPDTGTTFRISLPRVLDEVATPVQTADANAPEGTETILMVEDEEAVRRVGAQLLRGQGYKVLEARDGVEALQIVREYDRDIALCFTDLVLPGVGGADLAKRVQGIRPSVKVLFTTGYSSDSLHEQSIDTDEGAVLSKPYSRSSLSQKVRAVLDN